MTERRPAPVVLEIAAALLVPAAAYGFIRVFEQAGDLAPIAGTALLSTAVSVLLRRLRVPLSLSALVSLALLGILLINRFAEGTAVLGIVPTGATRDAFQAMLDELVLNFQELRTPVPALDPFVAAGMTGAWVMAFLTDWGALRLRLAFEPVLPGGLLFVFSAVLGSGAHRMAATVVFAAAVGFWAVAQRTVNLAETSTWLSHDRQRGTSALARAGAVFAALALFVGLALGPRLPGASAEELLSFRDAGDPTRTVISPFVSIEAQLVRQSDTPLFTVAADKPSYWRLAGLDNYEENIWKVAGNFSPEDGELPLADQLGGTRSQVTQEFTITALSAIWLPAAFAPTQLLDASADVTWNADTSSLTVSNDLNDSDGITYTLVSSVPEFTAEELTGAPATVPPDIAERYLALPELSPAVRGEAEQVTAGAGTRYEQMLALQDYFQNFAYSTELGPRQGDPVEQFLEERVGFCQQFSTAFALMARHLGAPARVASGFTWGDPIDTDEEGRTIYQVSGRQAHAWPEVWFEGLGWVAFEPTPGRGAPGASGYSNLPAIQDSLVQPDSRQDPITPSTTVPGDTQVPDVAPSIPIDDFTADPGTTGTAADSEGGLMSLIRGVFRWLLYLLVVSALPLAYVGIVLLAHRIRRDRRRQRATTPADRVEVAWAEATEWVELGYGLDRRPSETRAEFAARISRDRRVPAAAVERLAQLVTVARYFPPGLGEDDASEAAGLSGEIHRSVTERVSAQTRLLNQIDPRRVLRPSSRLTVTAPTPMDDVEPRRAQPRPDELVLAGTATGQPGSNGSGSNGRHPPSF